MPATALAFALAAAVVHALWNVLLARAPDVEAATAVALVVSELVFLPVAVATWRADSGVWPFALVSGVLELVYFALLAFAYGRAPLSVVYPVARGTAPVLVLLAALAGGAAAGAQQVVGVLLVAVGVVLVRGVASARLDGLVLGLAVACSIAAYTLVDKHGIGHAAPLSYLVLTMAIPTAVYSAAVARRKGGPALRAATTPASVAAGIASFVAYALVLAALKLAPASSVAAVRETSVVFATVLAAVVLREHVSRWRLLGACVVVGGVAVLAL